MLVKCGNVDNPYVQLYVSADIQQAMNVIGKI